VKEKFEAAIAEFSLVRINLAILMGVFGPFTLKSNNKYILVKYSQP